MIKQQVSLQHLNTLRLSCIASHYCQVSSIEELVEAANYARLQQLPLLLLGEGSNLVLPSKIRALVVKIELKGVRQKATDSGVIVTAAAGESWDSLVAQTARDELWGLENLSLIPGTVGAAPIQNIGAYGVEVKDRLLELRALDLASGTVETFDNRQCEFAYRDSVFKQRFSNRFAIIDCTFKLNSVAEPQLSYGALQNAFNHNQGALSPRLVRDYICQLRQSKLPDPRVTPNAGSFFKNPVVSEAKAKDIEKQFPELVSYPVDEGRKLAAGWMIEQAGFKGVQRGSVGVYDKQALVLTSNGCANASDLQLLVDEIRTRIAELFGVSLEVEPRSYDCHGQQVS
ncbi:UDP-N-acetylmuramate dehydrogenase [Aestuariirhabdus sp. Z084]|uniref:UDP-N-acetylmuramate dehydrogenase n=1 Tax=Aestuariirhabdus haliotis TaxID=2918751 RepID=UPI00201B3CF9|nr:UDP-N-acetylmuramate dehydrogenase [Aestuariirhabdus haliotis]MCL6414786.1 UDP-N-acetylmuramate dehydrogenase [Aestuariirhabdus haliotis]MCL6418718.1 UDP-N-acetylmuramate dehydrogenase [Aestuariirhabdus haliotis]